jgi:hypothetical protein
VFRVAVGRPGVVAGSIVGCAGFGAAISIAIPAGVRLAAFSGVR